MRLKKRIVNFGSANYRFKPLIIGSKSNSGRNVNLKIVTRNRGSGVKSNYYNIDYNRTWSSNLSICLNILKNPSSTAFISLIKYSNGTFSYILASNNLKPGFFTFTTIKPSIFALKIGDLSCNILLKYMDYTYPFFNVELFVGQGGKYARSAGVFCKILAFNLDKDIIKILLPSGVSKIVSQYCLVTLGRASNINHHKEFFCKAGYNRNLGFKSKVRGVAMNPVDHPHGGRTKTNSPEVTPWGKVAKFNK